MEIARAEDQRQDEDDADTRVQRQADSLPHERLAESADKGEHVAKEVELSHLGRVW